MSRPPNPPPKTKPGRGTYRIPMTKRGPTSRNTSAVKLESLKRGNQESPDIRGASKVVLPKIRSMVDRFDDLIEGKFDDLPPKPPSEVRIFLSSTFSDMRTERNWLAKEAYPKIKEYCYNELHIDFSVVDMRWGITDDATNEHGTEELCLAEIANCQRVGLGPTFVTMLGDRYGCRPIPSLIPEHEFDIILSEALVFDRQKVDLLKNWYVKDENAVPPVYLLQPISTKIPGFGDHSNEAIARQAKDQWWAVMYSIQEVLRTAVDSARHNGHVADERRHDYYKSVTEFEIQDGLIDATQPNASCLCFTRKFVGLDNQALKTNLASAQRFVEVKTQYGQNTVDQEVERMRNSLQQQTIPKYLNKDRIYQYKIPWQPEGVKPEKYDSHLHYVENLCGDFINGILTQISLAKNKLDNQIPTTEYYSTYDEILHHLHFCKTKEEQFRGQDEVLMQAKEYLLNHRNRSPLVLYAESGGGKTSLMAKIFTMLPKWFGPNIFRCIRFLGTSPLSTNIFEVLFTVAGQLADNYDKIMEPVGYKTMRAFSKYFPRHIRNVSRITKQQIIILLDSVDQLSPLYDAYSMKWLMTELPSNVKIVISMLPTLHGILDNTRAMGLKPTSFIQVKPLKESTGLEIIDARFKRAKRTLTASQMSLVVQSVRAVPNPLFLKLVLDRAVTWKSDTDIDDVIMPTSVRGAIHQLFDNLEAKFGGILISHTLGYITVGLNGLSEVELEDVLSCDDAVLDEIYQYHNPPVEGIIRVPPVLWARVRYEIREYLSERKSQSKTTLYWYHRQFIEVATERYAQQKSRMLHQGLANYYQAENGVQRDITLSKRKLTIPDADRQVTANPLVPQNIRVLMTLPYHLRHTRDVIQLKLAALCNLRFMMTKIKAFGISGLIKDYEEVSSEGLMDGDLRIVHKCLEEIKLTLPSSQSLPGEILARIPDDKPRFPFASQLVSDCRNHILNQGGNSILPLFPCLYETTVAVETVHNISKVIENQGNLVLVEMEKATHTKGEDSSTLAVMDFSELAPQILLTCKSEFVRFPQLSRDGRLLYSIGGNRKSQNEQGNHCVTTTIFQQALSEKERSETREMELQFPVQYDLIGQLDDYVISCYDVAQNNSLVVACYGSGYVGVHNADDGCATAEYHVVHKTAQHPNSNAVMVQGTQQKFITCSFAASNTEVILLLESTENEELWTTLNIQHLHKSNCQSMQIPGRAIPNKWLLTKDEKYFVVPVSDTSGITRIVTFDFEAGKFQSLKVTDAIIDFAVFSVRNLMAFVLTDSAINVYNVQTQDQVTDLAILDVGPTRLMVEEDGQYLYLASASGYVRVWKTEEWKNIGKYDFACGAITDMMLTNQDESLVVSCANHTLKSIGQVSLIDSCQPARDNDMQISNDEYSNLSEIENTQVLLVQSSNSTSELLTCTNTGQVITWNLETYEIESRVKLSSNEQFSPHSVIYSNTNHAIFYDNQQAVLLDIADQSVMTSLSLEGKTIVSMTTDGVGVAYALLLTNGNKLSMLVIDMATGNATKGLNIQDTVNSSDVEIMLSSNKKYLVLKVLCSEKELEIIAKSEKAMVMSGAARHSAGKYKALALNIQNPTGKLIPCYRQLTNIICLCESAKPLTNSLIMLGRSRKVVIWDIDSGSNDQKIVKGTKIGAFFRPHWIEDWDVDWYKCCFGRMDCLQLQPTEDGAVCATGSEDGWLMLYDAEGLSIMGDLPKTSNNPAAIVAVRISASGAWVASSTVTNVLKCWSVHDNGAAIFSIKLNVKVKQIEFSTDDTYVVVLGERSDQTTKVLLFKIIAKY